MPPSRKPDSRPTPPAEGFASFPPSALHNATLEFFHNGVRPDSLSGRIIRAVATGDTATLAKLLADPASFPDKGNAFGVTPLMIAAARGYKDCLLLLTAHPLTTLDLQTVDGWSALHFAARFNEAKAAEILLRKRASPALKTTAGKTARDLACGTPCEKVFTATGKNAPQEDFAKAAAAIMPDPPGQGDALFFLKKAAGRGDLQDCIAQANRCLKDGPQLPRKIAQEILTAAVLGTGDPNVVAWALQNGARSDALIGTKKRPLRDILMPRSFNLQDTAFARAYWDGKGAALREMILWADDAPAPEIIDTCHRVSRFNLAVESFHNSRSSRHRELQSIVSAFGMFDAKNQVKGMSGKKLRAAFDDAIARRDLNLLEAAWVESRKDRFIRGRVFVPQDSLEKACLLLIEKKRLAAARDMQKHLSSAIQQRWNKYFPPGPFPF